MDKIRQHFTNQVDTVTESIQNKFTINFLKNQILKNAYGNTDTIISKLDPRVLMVWYLFFAIAPWFIHDPIFLISSFLLVTLTTIMAKVVGLVLFLFLLGVFTQTGYLFIVILFFGGDTSALLPLLILTLKVSTVSLASITVFSGMDPDKIANGLLWFGVPESFSFSLSYAYRILPILMEEFQNIMLSFRLRGNPPNRDSFKGKILYIVYFIKMVMNSFYPLMLNTAKRSRTTVEALELKGYRYAEKDKLVKKMKLKTLKIQYDDLIFVTISFLWIMFGVLLSTYFKGVNF